MLLPDGWGPLERRELESVALCIGVGAFMISKYLDLYQAGNSAPIPGLPSTHRALLGTRQWAGSGLEGCLVPRKLPGLGAWPEGNSRQMLRISEHLALVSAGTGETPPNRFL